MARDADPWFRDKTVLLAGASGQLGAVVARRLFAAGAKLALTVRRPWQVEALAASLGVPRSGERTLVGAIGSKDSESAAGFVKGVGDALGPIDALLVTTGAFAAAEAGKDRAELAQDLLDANYLAPLTLARAVIPAMKRRRAGTLVFTGARAVGTPVPGLAHYLAAKAALHAFAACLHAELAAYEIGVAVVAPGALDTEANRQAMPHEALVPLELVATRLLEAAAGRPAGGAPLYRVPDDG